MHVTIHLIFFLLLSTKSFCSERNGADLGLVRAFPLIQYTPQYISGDTSDQYLETFSGEMKLLEGTNMIKLDQNIKGSYTPKEKRKESALGAGITFDSSNHLFVNMSAGKENQTSVTGDLYFLEQVQTRSNSYSLLVNYDSRETFKIKTAAKSYNSRLILVGRNVTQRSQSFGATILHSNIKTFQSRFDISSSESLDSRDGQNRKLDAYTFDMSMGTFLRSKFGLGLSHSKDNSSRKENSPYFLIITEPGPKTSIELQMGYTTTNVNQKTTRNSVLIEYNPTEKSKLLFGFKEGFIRDKLLKVSKSYEYDLSVENKFTERIGLVSKFATVQQGEDQHRQEFLSASLVYDLVKYVSFKIDYQHSEAFDFSSLSIIGYL